MKKHKNKLGLGFIALLGLGLMLLALGCKGESKGKNEPVVTKRITTSAKAQKQPAKPAAAKAKVPAGQTTEAPPAVQTARLPFDPTGKIDPFRPLFK